MRLLFALGWITLTHSKIKCNSVEQLASPFMMTSDGVHDYISVDQMEDIIAEHGMTISASVRQMIATARNNGSNG